MPNFVQQLVSQMSTWFQRQRTSIYGQVVSVGTTEVYSPIEVTNAVQKGFEDNTAVYSIVMKDAKKFGEVPRYVYGKKKAEEPLMGDLNDLLQRPNEWQGQDAFFTLARACYKVCGEVFIWLNRGDTDQTMGNGLVKLTDEEHSKKPVLEMYVLPANKIIVAPDPSNFWGCLGYMLEANIRVPIRKVDVIHWKMPNLQFDPVSRTHLRGMPPLKPGYKTLQQNNDAVNAAVRMYQNGGAKGAMVNRTLAKLTPQQETQLRDTIDGKVNSTDVKNAISAFQGDWTYLNFGLTSVDMELLNGKQLSIQELCFLFGVPYEFYDSKVTYANKQEAQKGWISNEIKPDCRQFDGELNRVLLKAFGMENKATIESDFDDLPEMQEDKAKQVEWLMKVPYITPNQVLEALGYETRSEAEFDEPWVPQDKVPLSEFLAGDGSRQMLADIQAQQSNGQLINQ